MPEPSTEQMWHALTEEIITGMRDWRAQHPHATFRDIEDALDSRVHAMRARMLEHLAHQSTAAAWEDAPALTHPTGPQCGTRLPAPMRRHRTMATQGGQDVHVERTYGTCPQCGAGVFPPR